MISVYQLFKITNSYLKPDLISPKASQPLVCPVLGIFQTAAKLYSQARTWVKAGTEVVLLRQQPNRLTRIKSTSSVAKMLFWKTKPCWLICADLVSQLSHAEGCSILYHRWINILRKPFLQAAHPKANSAQDSRSAARTERIAWRAEMVLRYAALIIKQSLSGGCPAIDVCYHTDINGKQKYKIVIITITIITWSTTDPAVSV